MRPTYTFEWHSAGAVAAVAGADHNTILISIYYFFSNY